MANIENLKPKTTLSKEEAKRLGSAGGKKSVEVRRQRKSMKEQLELLMKLPLKNEKAKQMLINLGINPEDIDNQMALTVAVFNRALQSGDVRAYELIRDTLGEKPVERIENIEPPRIIIERPKKDD